MDQNRKPRVKPTHYGHLIFDKRGKNIQWRKDNVLTSGAGKTGQPLVKNISRTLSNTIHKNKLKMDQKI